MNDPARSNRCQHVGRTSQCGEDAVPGHARCQSHLPRTQLVAHEQRQYLLTKIDDRVRLSQFAEHDSIKSLRDEIAMARLLVEKRFNLIRNDAELLTACAPINQLLLTIERLVKTCHTMEQSLGSLLARTTVLALGRKLCEVIVNELQGLPDYENVIDQLIEKLVPVLAGETNVAQIQTHQS